MREAVRLAPDPAAVHAALDAFLAGGLRSRAGEADDPETPESAAGAMSAGAAA